MAQEKSRWYLSLHITLYLFLTLVQGVEETDNAFKNGRNLVLEYFLPINFPVPIVEPKERSKRDVEGSGEDPEVFSELKEKSVGEEDSENATENFVKFVPEASSNVTNVEGSGEVESSSDSSLENSTEEEDSSSAVPIIADNEETTTEEVSASSKSEETVASTTTSSEENLVSTEMVFDKSEDFTDVSVETTSEVTVETTTQEPETVATTEKILESTAEVLGETTEESTTVETTTLKVETTTLKVETTTSKVETTSLEVETTTSAPTEPSIIPILIPEVKTEDPVTTPSTTVVISKAPATEPTPTSTEGLPLQPQNLTTPEPIVEEVFNVKTVHKTLEASPGNILRKENLTLGADRLLIVTNTRVMDSEENVQLSSEEPKRLGAYIVIGLILLSFFSLIGYITFRKRMNRKRQEFESNQESNDTEKALLSLSDYKDNSELEENHLKNNEITPIVVKSNSQINKFEKNTNFSSPKNLNTIANEKNIEKDNVLKSTAENLTQVIIEDSPKEVEEEKNVPSMEKLIVKTRIDQDSIPKKPIIINRSSTGYIPIPQDNL